VAKCKEENEKLEEELKPRPAEGKMFVVPLGQAKCAAADAAGSAAPGAEAASPASGRTERAKDVDGGTAIAAEIMEVVLDRVSAATAEGPCTGEGEMCEDVSMQEPLAERASAAAGRDSDDELEEDDWEVVPISP